MKKLLEWYSDKYHKFRCKIRISREFNTCHIVPYEVIAIIFEASIKGKTKREVINVFKYGLFPLMHSEDSKSNMLSLLSSDNISWKDIKLMSEIFMTDQNNYAYNLYPGNESDNKSGGSRIKETKKLYHNKQIFKEGQVLRQWLRERLIDYPKEKVNKLQHQHAEKHVTEFLELFARVCEENQQSKQFNLPVELAKLRGKLL